MANFIVTRGLGGLVENAKVNVGNLYLRQIFARWDNNQSDVIEPNAETALGKTAVNNWGIYDGAGSEAKLVANGQGMQALAGNWNSFTLVFTVERFKESTLQVMGANVAEENEWAIVGGTGEFAMARGIIKRRVYSVTGGTLTQELNIEFFCRMKVPAPIKRGPWGGNGGTLREMEGKSQRLESVTINHGGVVHAIGFSYIDENGQIRTAGIWGLILNAAPDKTETIKFGPSEVVKQIVGSRRPATAVGSNLVFITKFQIVTNQQTYGPFGTDDGSTSFSYTVPDDETVVGFFANTSDRVYKIGLYTI